VLAALRHASCAGFSPARINSLLMPGNSLPMPGNSLLSDDNSLRKRAQNSLRNSLMPAQHCPQAIDRTSFFLRA
jgi:hypothetical protein